MFTLMSLCLSNFKSVNSNRSDGERYRYIRFTSDSKDISIGKGKRCQTTWNTRRLKYHLILFLIKKINLNKPNPTLHWWVGTSDSQWYPEILCLIMYALDIHAFIFENRFFYLWFLFSSDLRISYLRKNKEINRIKHFCQL